MTDHDVQIDLLGPFTVRVGGREVPVSGFKPRALLATLALEPGRTVSMDRLCTVLWDTAPASRSVVHTYVRRLRSALGEHVIATATGGYRLDLAGPQIDLHRFCELARCPDDLPATERRQRLAEAVELWRGPPFADLHCDYLERDVAPEITEEFLRAVERRVDAEWELGEPTDSVSQLQRLAAQHPLRESLWLRLLVTLQRQHRTAEALQAYETIRARLADELGTDPSPPLQRVYQELLTGESVPVEAALPMPRQLPLDVHRFLGRGAELEQLDQLFGDPDDGTTIVAAITGPAGAGKTALAVRWAHRADQLFPDGQLYADLRGFGPGDPVAAGVTLEMFLQALNIPAAAIPPDPQARAALLRSSLSGRRVLLVLDNARDEEQVRPLLPGAGGRVVVTSRNRLPGLTARDDAVRIDLGGLDTAQAVDLLGRDSADPDTARTLVALCGHLPLPLRVIGERLAHDGRSLTEVLEELRDIGLDAFPDQDRASDLRAVFSWSYRALPGDAARVFRLLGAYRGQEISIEAAAALAGLTPHQARRQLDRLTDVSLLQQRADRRYRFHDLLGAYAAELSEVDGVESTAARHRLQEWFLHTALDAESAAPAPDIAPPPVPRPDGLVLPVFHDTADRVRWFDTEQPALVAVINQAAAAGEHEFVCRLSRPLLRMLWFRHRWTDQIAVSHRTRASAGLTGDTRAEFLAVQSLGNAACDTKNLPEAYRWHIELFDIACGMGSRVHEMAAWATIGVDCAVAEDFDEAARAFGLALELSRELNNPRLTARYSGHLAYVHNNVGEYEQALPVAENAVRVLRGLPDQSDLAVALMTLGTALTGLSRCAEAIAALRESVARFGPHGNQQLLAGAHTGLAEALLAAGRRDEAVSAWRAALDIAIRIGDPDVELIRRTIAEHEA